MSSSFTFTLPYKTDYGQSRCRNCDTNLTGSSPADQYQRLKIIQNTVRVPSSLYTMNLGALSAYKQATPATYGVCWNQQSDRPVPSVALATVPSGSTSMAVSSRLGFGNYGYAGRSYTQTCSRPGGQTPGGVGCDIKHNSYARRLNRLKAKGPLKQQGAPVSFGEAVPFNLAYPIYGGKTMKTGIIAGCDCNESLASKQAIFTGTGTYNELYSTVTLTLSVGEYVYALYPGVKTCYSRATILIVNGDGTFVIQFDDGTTDTQELGKMRPYYPCSDSGLTSDSNLYVGGLNAEIENGLSDLFNLNCIYPNNTYFKELFA